MVIGLKINIINACSDLGVNIDGADIGPLIISKNLDSNKINNTVNVLKSNIKKSKDVNDLKKNLKEVNEVNRQVFNEVSNTIKGNLFPITIGGDHSIAIGSALASIKENRNLGIIWIDAHLDYNTFDTTITGNLHGLPLAAIDGLCPDLTNFFDGNYYNPNNTVVVGYRAKETNAEIEVNNVKNAGAHIFTDEDINKCGIEEVMKKAIEIASNGTNGIHISYDLDVINPEVAPGVSVPEIGGFDLNTAYKVRDILCDNIDKIKSFDLVEYNPSNDIDNKTLDIALNIVNKIIDTK